MIGVIYAYIRSKPEGQYVQVHQIIRDIGGTKEEIQACLNELLMQGVINHHHARTIGSKHAYFWGDHGPKISAAVALSRNLPAKWGNEKAIHDSMFKSMKIAMLARRV